MSEQLAQQLLHRQKKMRMVAMGVLLSLVLIALGYTASIWWQQRLNVAPTMSPNLDFAMDTEQMQRSIEQLSQVGATDEQTRKLLQANLAQLDTDLQALEQNVGLQMFAAAELSDFRLALDQAYAAYGVMEYVKAGMLLEALGIELPDLVTRWEAAYLGRHNQAQVAYNTALQLITDPTAQTQMTHAINMAQLLNTQTKALAPNFVAADALASDIAAFPEFRAARQDLAVAEAENNIEKQIQALQNLISINPNLSQEKADLARLQGEVRQAEFARLMAVALVAYDSGNTDSALQALNEADKTVPNSAAVSELRQQISTENMAKSQAKLLRQIQMTQQLDDWQTTALLAQKGVQQYPNNVSLQETLTLSNTVIETQNTLQKILAAPERLADENIRRYAKAQLQNAESLLALSATLAQQSQTLNAVLAEQTAPITITVRSDNRSSLSVQGVGKMGQVTQRTLNLAPGTYVFIAQRQGYQTKRQTVKVVPNIDIVVDLACDERI